MAHLGILLYPDKRLKQTSQPVKNFLKILRSLSGILKKPFAPFPDAWEWQPPRWLDLKGLF
jgi:hypothetical protein